MNAVQQTTQAAQMADDAWEKAVKEAGFKSRWDQGSHGEPGTQLRALYVAKLDADRENHAAWEADRATKRAKGL